MKRILRWLVVLGALALLTPIAAFVGFGLLNGLDVVSGLAHLFDEVEGTTIDASRVPTRPAEVRWLGNIDDLALSEASGLAASTMVPDVLWAVNDSANEPRVFAFSPNGDDLGSRPLDLPVLGDWEDLASYRDAGRSYLLIADVGDNLRWRPELNLFILAEPEIADLGADQPLPIERVIRFTYPTGYRDSEAVAVDPSLRQILVLAKRVIPAEMYRIPLDSTAESVVTAEKIALLHGIPRPTERDLYEDERYGKSRSSPTALDISGRRAMVLTYQDLYLFERHPNEAWGDAFARIPERIRMPLTGQQEAGAFSQDGTRFYTTVERGRGTNAADIFEVRMTPDGAAGGADTR